MQEPPKFINTNVETIEQEVLESLEKKLDKTFQPGQLERLYCQHLAYRESLSKIAMQKAALLNLIEYSHCPILNEIGKMLDCEQLQEQYSKAAAEVGVNEARDYDIIVPKGTQIETKDGKFTFITDEDVIIPMGDTKAQTNLTCISATSNANGYLAGEINSLLPLSEIDYAKNITTSSGGADIESEDSYKSRLKLALNKMSCAGSRNGYIYYAKSAHQDIIDVQVDSPELPATFTLNGQTYTAVDGVVNNSQMSATVDYITGDVSLTFTQPISSLQLRIPPDSLVEVYPLTKNAALPDTIKEAVIKSLNAEEVRPLTDKVVVLEPVALDFEIDAKVIFYKTADKDAAKRQIEANIDSYIEKMKLSLAKSVVPSEIIALIQRVDGVYSVELKKPDYKTLKLNQYANISANIKYVEVGV